jgi:uncharacterized lipoprotein YajG
MQIDHGAATGARHLRQFLVRACSLALCLCSLVMIATGCAFTRERVALSYEPQVGVTALDSASTVKVRVEVVDARIKKDRISCKKNGYGMEGANFEAAEDVTKLVARAIETELTSRGFGCDNGPVVIAVELSNFYCDFKIGVFAGDAVGEVAMNVQVKDKGGKILFSKIVNGENRKGAGVAGQGNVKVVLEAALKMAVANLMDDKSFIDSILTAKKS